MCAQEQAGLAWLGWLMREAPLFVWRCWLIATNRICVERLADWRCMEGSDEPELTMKLLLKTKKVQICSHLEVV